MNRLVILIYCIVLSGTYLGAQNNCVMVCNTNLNLSLGTDCIAEITASTTLKNPLRCSPPDYTISLSYNGTPLPNSPFVDASHIGKTIRAATTHNPSGNLCISWIRIVDAIKPVITCDNVVVPCSTTDLSPSNPSIGSAQVLDNCDSDPSLIYSDMSVDVACGQTYQGQNWSAYVVRTWNAVDEQGNVAIACNQIIGLARHDINDVVWPADFDDIDQAALNCPFTQVDTTVTGQPTIYGQAINLLGSSCELTMTFQDQVLNSCGGSKTVLRNWIVSDQCTNQTISHLQTINFRDTEAPQITCPAAFTASTCAQGCYRDVGVAAADVIDNCSNVTVETRTPVGTLYRNGGVIYGLPIGHHIITYVAKDACNNTSSCTTTVTLEDHLPPIAICDSYTVVSLQSNGTARVPAQVFDDGSYDHCCAARSLTYQAKFMGSNEPFRDSLYVDCQNLGNQTVIVNVADCYGNLNQCMVSLEIQDKIGPSITCPPSEFIQCRDDFGDYSIYGMATAIDNCGVDTIYERNPIINLNSCGVGTVTRRFRAVDTYGYVAACHQKITIQNHNLFRPTQITWPEDYQTASCIQATALDPDSLTMPYAYPTFTGVTGHCEELGTSYDDQPYYNSGGSCILIKRKWTVVDWCQNPTGDPTYPIGYWTYTQLLKIMDDQPPTLTSVPMDTMITFLDPDCHTTLTWPAISAQDCGTVTTTVQSSLGNGFGPFQQVSPGDYVVNYTVSDGCLNAVNHQITVTVKDGKKPTLVLYNGLAANVSSTPPLELHVDWFIDTLYDNCTASGDLIVSFSPDPTDTIITYDCDSVGVRLVTIYISDLAGNIDFVNTYITIQDQTGSCDPNTGSIQAFVKRYDQEPVETVDVQVDKYQPVRTDANGQALKDGLPHAMPLSVSAFSNHAIREGVTTKDLLDISKHLMGVVPFTSPYEMLAADVNGDQRISASDLSEIRRVILHKQNNFRTLPCWGFHEASQVFSNNARPWDDTLQQIIFLDSIGYNQVYQAEFIGWKLGDVNLSAQVNANSFTTNSRQADKGQLAWERNEEHNWTLYIMSDSDLEGFQFSLSLAEWPDEIYLPQGDYEFRSNELLVSSLSSVTAGQRIAIASWNIPDQIRLTSVLSPEVYPVNGSVGNIALKQVDSKQPLQVSPNPVHDELWIANMDKSASFEIYNAYGQRFRQGVYHDGDRISVVDLPQGSYIIMINDGHSIESLTWIKD